MVAHVDPEGSHWLVVTDARLGNGSLRLTKRHMYIVILKWTFYFWYVAINFTFPALKCYFDCYVLRNVSTLYTILHGRVCTCLRDHVAAAVAVLCMERKQLCCIIYKKHFVVAHLQHLQFWPVGTTNVPSPSTTMCTYVYVYRRTIQTYTNIQDDWMIDYGSIMHLSFIMHTFEYYLLLYIMAHHPFTIMALW